MSTAENTALGAGQDNQYLTFTLGEELYALAIPGIKEIIEFLGKLHALFAITRFTHHGQFWCHADELFYAGAQHGMIVD